MKLKKAVIKAKELGYKWIAVDKDLSIWGYVQQPCIAVGIDYWNDEFDDPEALEDLGLYSGLKSWKDTLREV